MKIKMQRGSRCNEDQDATRIKMQRGSRCQEDQDATRIKMQWGSRCNEDQDATRIKMQQGFLSKWYIEFVPLSSPFKNKSQWGRVCQRQPEFFGLIFHFHLLLKPCPLIFEHCVKANPKCNQWFSWSRQICLRRINYPLIEWRTNWIFLQSE